MNDPMILARGVMKTYTRAGERLTVHTHGRLTALAAMNEARTLSQKNLDAISEALAGIFAANEMSRQFLDAQERA